MQKNLSEIVEANNENMKCILTKFQQDYFRECGMKEAFNCILKIYLSPENGGYSKEVLKEIFLESDFSSIISDFSIIEITEKIKSYEEENKIDVGDEIFSEITKTKAVVQRIDSWDRWEILTESGQTTIDDGRKKYWKKTGRNFPQIAEILEEMRC